MSVISIRDNAPMTPDYNRAFTADSLGGLPLDRVTLPNLRLPNGRLVICDPMIQDERRTAPFTLELKPGDYPVELALALVQVSDGEQQIPAFARVVLGEGTAVRWEPALRPEQDLAELKPGHVYGFAVDTGVAAYMDDFANEVLIDERRAYFDEDEPEHDEPDLHRELDEAMKGAPVCRWGAIDIMLENEPLTNLVGFSSGPGDGVYPSYWGFDEKGELIELITDFWVVPREVLRYMDS